MQKSDHLHRSKNTEFASQLIYELHYYDRRVLGRRCKLQPLKKRRESSFNFYFCGKIERTRWNLQKEFVDEPCILHKLSTIVACILENIKLLDLKDNLQQQRQ